MKFGRLQIKNFKSIRDLVSEEIDYACILVGKNSTGKSIILDAIRSITGDYKITDRDYQVLSKPIEIHAVLNIEEDDLDIFYAQSIVSTKKDRDEWQEEFQAKLPSFDPDTGHLTFTFQISSCNQPSYLDHTGEHNFYIPTVLPKIYFIDVTRNINKVESDFVQIEYNENISHLRHKACMFDIAKDCTHCFACMHDIYQKSPEELTLWQSAKLLEYKLYHNNLNLFSEKLNECFRRNSGKSQEIRYQFHFNMEEITRVDTFLKDEQRGTEESIYQTGAGTRGIYALSLLETYISEEKSIPSIILIEEPEIYLHPQMQKSAGEVLFKLSKKNQVLFTTHSPNMLFNFSSRQIKQIVLDEDYFTICKEDEAIDEILDDLGYAASDLMNVSFVFIVEGKQDRNRLPLLLEKYYSELYDDNGKFQRISIITTNSCTNIKTYANLKYMNQVYLKDQFLMIRDSDGKKPEHLVKQLCSYYAERGKEEEGKLPHVTPRNVLVLRYYSFENYFLDPAVMAKIGVIKNEDEFYTTLFQKYKDYLFKLPSVKRLHKIIGKKLYTKQDLVENMDLIRIHVRGHNLYDIFYSKYRKENETEILRRYVEEAPRETFQDILEAIDRFVYFENRKK